MFRMLFQSLAWRYRRYQDTAFDSRYGLDTAQCNSSYLQQIASDNTKYAVPYEPVQIYMFRRMLRDLALDISNYVFLDLGSGKGRALFLAAQYNFSRIIGVEFSPQLHMVAAANAKSFRMKCRFDHRIELICQDATDYELPKKNLVLFLYNPFVGSAMKAVVAKIASFVVNEPHDLILLYRNPECSYLLDSMQGMDVISASRSYRIYRKSG